ncbi:MAG: ABC transporter ATP-binding protein [Oscillospiraceae bacterium]
MSNIGKSKTPKTQILKRLMGYMLKYKLMVFLALLLMFSSNILLLIGPKLSGYAIDAISLGKGNVDFQRVYHFCFLMIIFYTISSIMNYGLQRIMIKLSQNVSYKLRKDIFNSLSQLPVGYFDTHQTGDIISKISYDVDTVNETLCQDLLQIATSMIGIIGSFIMMMTISPLLITVFIITIPISLSIATVMSKKVRPLFRKRSAKLGQLNGYMEEIISGQKTIKSYHQEETMQSRFEVKNNDAVEAHFDADYMSSAIGPSMNFVNNLSMGLISVLGSILYLKGLITIGNVSTFILYSRKFSGPINEISNILSDLQSALSAAERIFALIDEKPEVADIEGAKELVNVKGEVKLENVKFGYTKEKEIIHNLSLEVKQGNLIAIVGHTGAGKTTIINLLMRFYDPNSGTISIDGNEIIGLTRKSLRLSYAMVLQDTWLFNGTIFENIAYGNEQATLEDVERVAKAANIHNYIMSLPDEYETQLNEDGMNISQGQKQLITIARAMLLDAKMLILDEATSNVDTITEMKIQKAMRELMKDKTCFVIAHRLSTIKNADTILVVENGDIIEQGKHDELLNKGGVYANLYNSQF